MYASYGSPEVMALVKLLDANRLPEGQVVEVRIGERQVAVSHVRGKFYAVEGKCPHNGGPLGLGALHGHQIVCPWHGWEFDCRTGACGFSETSIPTYPVRISGGTLWADIDA